MLVIGDENGTVPLGAVCRRQRYFTASRYPLPSFCRSKQRTVMFRKGDCVVQDLIVSSNDQATFWATAPELSWTA